MRKNGMFSKALSSIRLGGVRVQTISSSRIICSIVTDGSDGYTAQRVRHTSGIVARLFVLITMHIHCSHIVRR
jgi:hypothetical protein